MGWETRNGRRYYYESIWQNGVVRRYLGNGAAAKVAAAAVADRAEKRAIHRLKVMRFNSDTQEAESIAKRLSDLAKCLMEARLLADGYYLASFTWRKRRIPHDSNRSKNTA
jgi:hypothetical protein